MPQSPILFARQPIFDRELQVYGYELLYRSVQEAGEPFADGEQATSQVLLDAFTELAINDVVGEKFAFVNFTQQLLGTELPFTPQRLVVEVLEDQTINQELLDNLARLKRAGFTIALDDFVLTADTAALVRYADIIKLDVLDLSETQLLQHVKKLQPHARLLAEKIETHEQLEHCKSLGFSLFQGYFLSRPDLIKGKKTIENRTTVMALLAELYRSDISIDALEQIISRDPVLSYKLLRLINSAAYRFAQEISSLRQAIMLLGINQIRGWASLIALNKLEDKPKELITTTLTRAKLCQQLGGVIQPNVAPDSYFTLGLLSTVDAFLDRPLKDVIDTLPLSQELKVALTRHDGKMGLILSTIKQYEQGNWAEIDWATLKQGGLGALTTTEQYLEALNWVRKMESLY